MGTGGGILGAMFGGSFRASGGPVVRGKPYIVGEHPPDVFVLESVGKTKACMPALPSMSQMGGQTSQGSQPCTIVVDVRGATGASKIQKMVSEAVQQGIATYDKRRPARE
ncbi:hypothetical protein RMS29_028300 (plasmid) [Agrobacterium rosae]|uniref:Uncharacterized protein n=1 Tax=Agrobacterium rosae TaxID=1972867 RepID=A0ABU4W531_9HYPH|nr:hypothetical protein [Agrobacterium rosae]MDX8332889.1 hypothetical protein [Agrobacterium rosae]